jgi:arabinofuranosyltransferase
MAGPPGPGAGTGRRLVTALSIAALPILWGALYLSAARRAAGETGLPLDDAWIHARMARNLVRGEGLVFNPGEPSAASSAPLWTLLLAVPVRLGAGFPSAAYVLGGLLLLLLSWLSSRLVGRLTADRGPAIAAALFPLCTHPFPWLSVSGMEGCLAAALVLAVVLLRAGGRTRTALVLCVPAALTRPELLVLPSFVAIDRLLKRPGDPAAGAAVPARMRPAAGAGGRVAALAIGALAATAAPLFIHRILTGFWVPGSLAAKVGRHGLLAALGEGRLDRLPAILATNVPETAWPYLLSLARDNVLLLAAAPFGFLRLARGGSGTHLPWLLAALQPLAVGVLAPFGGPDFHEQRYIAFLVALVLAAGCAGLAALPVRAGRLPLRGAALAGALLLSAAGAWRGMGRYALEVKNITEMQMRVARWLAARPVPPRRVATNDIGAIGYVTGATVVDTTGLATPAALPYLRRPSPPGPGSRGWNGANQAALLEFLEAERPEYVAVFPAWYPAPFFRQALSPEVFRVDLEDNLICGDRTMVVYRPEWPPAAYNRLVAPPAGRRGGGRADAAQGS